MRKLNWNTITSEKRIPYLKRDDEARKYRSEFESDYLRIIRSASFRRLQDKTQVFPLDSSDFVRTRLTHSLEVSSIGKLIAKQVCELLKDQELETTENLPDINKVVEIINCAGLLHDLGNPPFGHFGEFAIRNWFCENLDKLEFKGLPLSACLAKNHQHDLRFYEGNAQALRIVSKLHKLIGTNGMRLTAAVLDSIIKYPCGAEEHEEELLKAKENRSLLKKKLGYFQSEKDLYHEIKKITNTKDIRNPLTFILEAADDLAYAFADIEDGFKKNLYTYQEFLDQFEDAEVEETKVQDHVFDNSYVTSYEDQQDALKLRVIRWLNIRQLKCITCCAKAFIEHYDEIMNGTFEQELLQVCKEAETIQKLKRFAFERIYHITSNVKTELLGNEILTFLMDRFMKALIYYDTDQPMSLIDEMYIRLLSTNYKENYHRSVRNITDENERLYYRLLLGCDFIAGMSDGYASRLYHQLNGM